MENALYLGSILGPVYVVLGLALLGYPKAFQKFMKYVADNHFHVFGMMFFQLFLGLVIIRMYNVWEWNVWLLVTLSGWGAFLKGVLYFLAPGNWMKGMMKNCATQGYIVFAGLVTLVIGGVLCYYSYMLESMLMG